MYWTSSSGKISLDITLDNAGCGAHPGRCDEDIAELRRDPYIAEQLEGIPPTLLRNELREWGYDDEELSNHDENLSRILWLACWEIVEENQIKEI